MHIEHHSLSTAALPGVICVSEQAMQAWVRFQRCLRFVPTRRDDQVLHKQTPAVSRRLFACLTRLVATLGTWGHQQYSGNLETVPELPDRQEPHQLRASKPDPAYRGIYPNHAVVKRCRHLESRVEEEQSGNHMDSDWGREA